MTATFKQDSDILKDYLSPKEVMAAHWASSIEEVPGVEVVLQALSEGLAGAISAEAFENVSGGERKIHATDGFHLLQHVCCVGIRANDNYQVLLHSIRDPEPLRNLLPLLEQPGL